MRVVFDTSVLIGPVSAPGAQVAISAVSLAELHYGVLVTADLATRSRRLNRLTDIQAAFPALPVDEQVARSYGQVAAAVAAAGRPPRTRVADLLIAATAHVHGAQLWTRNQADVRGLEGLVEVVAVAEDGTADG